MLLLGCFVDSQRFFEFGGQILASKLFFKLMIGILCQVCCYIFIQFYHHQHSISKTSRRKIWNTSCHHAQCAKKSSENYPGWRTQSLLYCVCFCCGAEYYACCGIEMSAESQNTVQFKEYSLTSPQVKVENETSCYFLPTLCHWVVLHWASVCEISSRRYQVQSNVFAACRPNFKHSHVLYDCALQCVAHLQHQERSYCALKLHPLHSLSTATE